MIRRPSDVCNELVVTLLLAGPCSLSLGGGRAFPALTVPQCSSEAIKGGQMGGGDYHNLEQPAGRANATACRAECCADPRCAFWGLDVKLPAPSRGDCTAGKPCCWLKTEAARPGLAACSWGCYCGASGRAPPAPPPHPPPPSPPPAQPPCATAMDCSLAGRCVTGSCVCLMGFTGKDCGALDIAPTVEENGWQPKGFSTWGGSPQRIGDTYHLYASLNRWGSVDTWPNSSVVVHATATSAVGPYGNHTVIVGNRSSDYFDGDAIQNPVALQLIDGSIALYYVGLSCAGPQRKGRYSQNDCEDSANSSLGVAHAPGPYGPWTRMDRPILTALVPMSDEGDALGKPASH